MLKRIDNLTGLRALASVWVLLYHIQGLIPSANISSWTWTQRFIAKGDLGVDVFFVLSGFVLSLVYVPKLPKAVSWSWYRHFIIRRFAKIYPMHLYVLLAS